MEIRLSSLACLLFLCNMEISSVLPRKHSHIWISPPQIWLSEYRTEDSLYESISADITRHLDTFQDDLVSKNGTSYTIQENVHTAVFVCESDYPIEWKFPDPEQVKKLQMYNSMGERRAIMLHPEMESPITTTFRIYFAIRATHVTFLRVNLTCILVDDDNDRTSTSVIVKIPSSDDIEYQGETIQATVPTDDDNIDNRYYIRPFTVPCRPTSPDVKLNIFKKDPHFNKNDKWIPLHYSVYYTFNPEVGFTVHPMVRTYSTQSALFKCVVEGGDDAFVFVNLTFVEKTQTSQFATTSRKHLSGEATLEFGRTKEGDLVIVKCCTGVAKTRPLLYVVSCTNPAECEVMKYTESQRFQEMKSRSDSLSQYLAILNDTIPEREGCSKDLLFTSDQAVLLFCKGENVDVMQHYVRRFVPKSGNKTHDFSNLYTSFPEVGNQDGPVGEKIVIKLGQPTDVAPRTFWSDDNATAPTFYYRMEITKPTFNESLLQPRISSFFRRRENNRTKVVDFNRNVYDGEPLYFLCFSSPYYYTEGAYLILNWKNGSKTVIPSDGSVPPPITYYHKADNQDFYLITTYSVGSGELAGSLDMKSVDCFAPRRSSVKWDKLTVQLNVLPSTKPKFFGDEDETVYFSLGDVGRKLTCEVLEAAPDPTVTLTKDDRPLEIVDRNKSKAFNGNATVSTITNVHTDRTLVTLAFEPVTHETHGVYKCTAKNVKGTAVKVWRVLISEESSNLSTILATTGVVIICAVLLGLGLRYWFQQQELQGLKRRQSSYVPNLEIN